MLCLTNWSLSPALAEEGDEDGLLEELSFLEVESEAETLIVSATKREQRVEEAPSIVEVISFQDIRRRGYRTVGEALRGLPGITVIDDLLNWNVGVRGLYAGPGSASDIVKVMINGQACSFRSTNGNFFGYELLPIEAVKRIEVIRGPGSALYGSNAFLGIINLVTFDGSEEDLRMKGHSANRHHRDAASLHGNYLQQDVAQQLNGGGSLYSGGQLGDFNYFAAGTFSYADRSGLYVPGIDDMIRQMAYRESPGTNPPPLRYPSPGWDITGRDRLLLSNPTKNDLERVGSAYAVLKYKLDDDTRVWLDGNFQYFDRFGEFSEFSYMTHENRLAHTNGFLRLGCAREVSQQGFAWSFSVALSTGAPTGDDHLVDALAKSFYVKRHLRYRAWDLVFEASYLFSEDNILSFGLDYSNDWEDLLEIETVEKSTLESSRTGMADKTFVNLGLYLQWMYRPLENLSFTLGTRLDHNNEIGCDTRHFGCIIPLEDRQLSAEDLTAYFEVLDIEPVPVFVKNRGFLQVSSRAGVVYQLPYWSSYIKFIYGSAFRPPSPFQLYHPQMTQSGSFGAPFLRPQTVNTFEVLLGAEPLPGLEVVADFFHTAVVDYLITFIHEWGVRSDIRNADVTVYGLEGKLQYTWKERLDAYFNATVLLESHFHPKKKWDESQSMYEHSYYNTELPGTMFPPFHFSAGFNIYAPECFLNVNFNVHYVGKRQASMVNNMLYNSISLENTYWLEDYFVADVTLTSAGLRLFWEEETILSLSFKNIPGQYTEPGYAGVDIPSLGPQVFLRISQIF